jgi:hypothetical protein
MTLVCSLNNLLQHVKRLLTSAPKIDICYFASFPPKISGHQRGEATPDTVEMKKLLTFVLPVCNLCR